MANLKPPFTASLLPDGADDHLGFPSEEALGQYLREMNGDDNAKHRSVNPDYANSGSRAQALTRSDVESLSPEEYNTAKSWLAANPNDPAAPGVRKKLEWGGRNWLAMSSRTPAAAPVAREAPPQPPSFTERLAQMLGMTK